MLGVELELVDLPGGEEVDQPLESGERRHLVATDVEHHAAIEKVRPVLDLEAPERLDRRSRRVVVEREPLAQGSGGVEEAGAIRRHDVDTGGADSQPIPLGRQVDGGLLDHRYREPRGGQGRCGGRAIVRGNGATRLTERSKQRVDRGTTVERRCKTKRAARGGGPQSLTGRPTTVRRRREEVSARRGAGQDGPTDSDECARSQFGSCRAGDSPWPADCSISLVTRVWH